MLLARPGAGLDHHMQPPTWLPAFAKGVQVCPFGHSELSVHITIPWQEPAATHCVPVMWWAKLPQPGAPSPMVAPAAQQSIPDGQSATGSSHTQSTDPEVQAVAVGWQAEGVGDPAGVSQQC
jgi:hypothetical protein